MEPSPKKRTGLFVTMIVFLVLSVLVFAGCSTLAVSVLNVGNEETTNLGEGIAYVFLFALMIIFGAGFAVLDVVALTLSLILTAKAVGKKRTGGIVGISLSSLMLLAQVILYLLAYSAVSA